MTAADFLLKYWPVISGSAVAGAALWARSDVLKFLYRAFADRVHLAIETNELQKRFTIEVSRADYWEQRCDDLDRQFRVGLNELARIKVALRTYKQLIRDLLADRDLALEWGTSLASELEKHGLVATPAPVMRFTAKEEL